jgi:hypothetical protein
VIRLADVISIAASSEAAFAVESNGTVWAWGCNTSGGGLGDGDVYDKALPVPVLHISHAISVVAGYINAYALTSEGQVYAWGADGYGQLGTSTVIPELPKTGYPPVSTPVLVRGLPRVKQIAVSEETSFPFHSPLGTPNWYNSDTATAFALMPDGSVYAWGFGRSGAIGNGRDDDEVLPTKVVGLSHVTWISGGDGAGMAMGIVSASAAENSLTGGVPTWGTPTLVDPGDPVSVSCSSASFCAAVDARGNVVTYNGAGWSHPANIEPPQDMGGGLNSVSCPTSRFCIAIDGSGHVLTYDGTRWSRPRSIELPGNTDAVSCPTSSFCAAVDSDAVVTYDGAGWSKPSRIDASGSSLTSVSCPSSHFCAAVDASGYALIYQGSHWSDPRMIDPNGINLSVSCSSSRFCGAVDFSGNLVTYNGTSWNHPVMVDPTGYLHSVSCPTSNFCAAVDAQGFVV